MLTALITGATGQDGYYMAELLHSKGYRIIGAVRDPQQASESLSEKSKSYLELISWNMLDQKSMTEALAKYRPQEIYNFAAFSSGTEMYYDPVGVGDVNGMAVARMLEAIRNVDIGIKICQASSREVFGEATETPQSESTRMCPRSPYGAAKLYADTMIRIYRQHYGLFACSAILFNHESPRRGLGFVSRKITHEAAKIKLGLSKKLNLGNLDARRDWGFAGDYVRGMWQMLQQSHPVDYVLATGEVHSVRDLCEVAFMHLGLDYRDYVCEEKESYRTAEKVVLVGNITKARSELKWEPQTGFIELIKMMVDEDMVELTSEN